MADHSSNYLLALNQGLIRPGQADNAIYAAGMNPYKDYFTMRDNGDGATANPGYASYGDMTNGVNWDNQQTVDELGARNKIAIEARKKKLRMAGVKERDLDRALNDPHFQNLFKGLPPIQTAYQPSFAVNKDKMDREVRRKKIDDAIDDRQYADDRLFNQRLDQERQLKEAIPDYFSGGGSAGGSGNGNAPVRSRRQGGQQPDTAGVLADANAERVAGGDAPIGGATPQQYAVPNTTAAQAVARGLIVWDPSLAGGNYRALNPRNQTFADGANRDRRNTGERPYTSRDATVFSNALAQEKAQGQAVDSLGNATAKNLTTATSARSAAQSYFGHAQSEAQKASMIADAIKKKNIAFDPSIGKYTYTDPQFADLTDEANSGGDITSRMASAGAALGDAKSQAKAADADYFSTVDRAQKSGMVVDPKGNLYNPDRNKTYNYTPPVQGPPSPTPQQKASADYFSSQGDVSNYNALVKAGTDKGKLIYDPATDSYKPGAAVYGGFADQVNTQRPQLQQRNQDTGDVVKKQQRTQNIQYTFGRMNPNQKIAVRNELARRKQAWYQAGLNVSPDDLLDAQEEIQKNLLSSNNVSGTPSYDQQYAHQKAAAYDLATFASGYLDQGYDPDTAKELATYHVFGRSEATR